MATTTEVLVKNPVLNDIPKSIYDTITPAENEIYAVDMEYTGNKVVVTDASGDVVESATNSAKLAYLDNVTSDIQTQLNSKVSDVTINSASVVSNNVAEIPFASASVYGVTKLSANLTSISDTIAASASMGNNLAQNIITGVGTYSNTSTYAVGDKTRKGQYYYECITPITSGHEWDANEWKQITIQEQIDGKQAAGNYVSYVTNTNVNVVGNTKDVSKTSPECLFVPNGLIMGGSASAAGLVTRGICGCGLPSSSGGCSKENLYINYDGDQTYRADRQLILQAGITGTHYGSNLYQYAAARGDAVKGYVDSTAVLDATVSGTSIVDANRVAIIPIAESSGDYGLVKLSSDSSGITLDSSSKRMQLRRATDTDIATKTQLYRPIVPGNLDLAIKEGLGNNSLTWDDTYQSNARNTIGATQVVIREWD